MQRNVKLARVKALRTTFQIIWSNITLEFEAQQSQLECISAPNNSATNLLAEISLYLNIKTGHVIGGVLLGKPEG